MHYTTALIEASHEGHVEVVKLLLSRETDIEAEGRRRSALHPMDTEMSWRSSSLQGRHPSHEPLMAMTRS